MKQKIL